MRQQGLSVAILLLSTLLCVIVDAAETGTTTEQPKTAVKETKAPKQRLDPCIKGDTLPESVKKAIEECKPKDDAAKANVTTAARRKRSDGSDVKPVTDGSEVKPVTDETRPVGDVEVTIPPNAKDDVPTTESPKARRKRGAEKESPTIVGNDSPNSDNEMTIPPGNDDETKPNAGGRKRRDGEAAGGNTDGKGKTKEEIDKELKELKEKEKKLKEERKEAQEKERQTMKEKKEQEKKEKKEKKEKEKQERKEKMEKERKERKPKSKEDLQKEENFRNCLWTKLNMIDESTKDVKEDGVKAIIGQLSVDDEKKKTLKEAVDSCIKKTNEADKSKNFWKVMNCVKTTAKSVCPDAGRWNFGRDPKPQKPKKGNETKKMGPKPSTESPANQVEMTTSN